MKRILDELDERTGWRKVKEVLLDRTGDAPKAAAYETKGKNKKTGR